MASGREGGIHDGGYPHRRFDRPGRGRGRDAQLAAETGGSLIVFVDQLERGKMTPLHAHPGVDEVVYVIEGEILVRLGDEDRRVGPGGTIVTPRDVPPAFMVLSDVARLFFVQTPGSGEAFYRQASEPATAENAAGVVNFARLEEVAKETGATAILGPPPFAK